MSYIVLGLIIGIIAMGGVIYYTYSNCVRCGYELKGYTLIHLVMYLALINLIFGCFVALFIILKILFNF